MKNKKALIIVILIIIILAIVVGIVKIYNSYLFNSDGTISDSHADLIQHLKSINDVDERKKQVDFAVDSNIITSEEANELY